MKIEVAIPKKVFNEVYYEFLDAPQREQIYFGGSSSGKSVFLAQRDVRGLLKGDRNFLICRNVARTIRGSVFNEMRKVIAQWGVSELFNINKSDLTITCKNGKQALFAGLDDVEKLKSITPENGVITDIRIEEATETNQDATKQLKKRLRGRAKVPKRLTYSFNPILKSHWIFQEYFSGKFADSDTFYKDDHALILKTTYKHNKYLEADDIRELENETDEYYYNVYTLGNWGVLGGIIFTNWKTHDLINDSFYKSIDAFQNGLDFGFSNDPTALTRNHWHRASKRLYICEEWGALECTNEEISNGIKPIIGRDLVTCDSAEPKSIRELKLYGINAIGAKKGKDSINHGIQWLKQQEIIVDIRCQGAINNLEQYQWKKDKEGNVLNIPVDKSNDYIDSIRYAEESNMTLMRQNWGIRVANG